MMANRITDSYSRHGLGHLARRSIEHIAVNSPFLNKIYWTLSPIIYNRLYCRDICQLGAPLKPFRLRYVDPKEINTITGRNHTALYDIGRVLDGNWDRCPGTDPQGFSNESKITETPLYTAIERRFNYGYDWSKTEFIRKVYNKISEDTPVWGCDSKSDVRKRCSNLDRLYRDISNNGYKTQEEISRENKWTDLKHSGFINTRLNEILVDIDRDGNLLFVDGKHRLAITKVLGLEKIPVTVIVRHNKWVNHLSNQYKSRNNLDHPDATWEITT